MPGSAPGSASRRSPRRATARTRRRPPTPRDRASAASPPPARAEPRRPAAAPPRARSAFGTQPRTAPRHTTTSRPDALALEQQRLISQVRERLRQVEKLLALRRVGDAEADAAGRIRIGHRVALQLRNDA